MDKLIDSIFIAGGNLEHVAKTKRINGTLRSEIKRVMLEYHEREISILNGNTEKRESKSVEFCQCTNEDVTLLEAITVCRHCLKQIKFK